ncbi:MAG: AEC family transporter, partial [Pseudomonadota bacterium]
MLAIFLTIAPVFILIAIGYVAVRSGYVKPGMGEALNTYAVKIAVPILLFRAMATLDFAQAFSVPLLISFYTGAIACFVLGIVGARIIFKRRPGEAVVIGFGATFSNSVLLGLAIVERSHGETALVPAFGIIAFHASSLYIMGMVTMELMRRDGRPMNETLKAAGKSIIANPLMIAILLGVGFNFSGLPLADPFETATAMVAASAIPAALVGIGASMTQYRMRSGLRESAYIAFLSLLVHPFIVLVLGHYVFELNELMLLAAVTIAAMPPGVNIYIFASMYDRAVDVAASAFLLSTLLAVVSVTLWLYALN